MNAEFLNKLGSSDMESLTLVLDAFRQYAFKQEVEDYGFNTSSGYVWVFLTNGCTIASCFGQDVVYIFTDFDNGEEVFLDSYEEWEQYDKDLMNLKLGE
jgi:hypothetical protein